MLLAAGCCGFVSLSSRRPTEGVGRIEESLRWGQPAYLTPETGSGSTIRLGVPGEGGFALYVHCRTTIIPDFRSLFPNDFTYEGNRAIRFEAGADLPTGPLRLLIASALTYHGWCRDRTGRRR